MDKKKVVLIVIAIILVIIIICCVVKGVSDRKEEEERFARTTSVEEVEDTELLEIQARLENSNMQLEVVGDIYSEILGENGKIVKINGEEMQLYNISTEKLQILTEGKSGDVLINGENGRKVDALVCGNTVILDCINLELKENIKNALEEVTDTQQRVDVVDETTQS